MLYILDIQRRAVQHSYKSCKNFNHLDCDNKLTWLMTNENVQMLVQFSKMILKMCMY